MDLGLKVQFTALLMKVTDFIPEDRKDVRYLSLTFGYMGGVVKCNCDKVEDLGQCPNVGESYDVAAFLMMNGKEAKLQFIGARPAKAKAV